MHREKKCADSLINTVLSECKTCEGEIKLTTRNVGDRFKKKYLEYTGEKQNVQKGLHRREEDSTYQNHILFCKIQCEKLLNLMCI
jgi:hypothetical protein